MIVVGLGNPGKSYEKTRHNLGFMFLDRLTQKTKNLKKITLKKSIAYKAGDDLFVYPMTYMNLSGDAITELKSKYSLALTELLVVCDDISLPLGTLRIRKKGSHGGHNGLKSIISALDTDAFARMRLGIGQPPDSMSLVDFVLQEFSQEEWPIVQEMLDTAVNAFFTIKHRGIDYAMSFYNRKEGGTK